jgi:hypothetical protein
MNKEADALFFDDVNLYVKRRVERDAYVNPLRLTHQQALKYAAKSDDGWRLPTTGEALDLFGRGWLEDTGYLTWTSAPLSGDEARAWVVNFDYGGVGHVLRSYAYYVRLVRSGPVSD